MNPFLIARNLRDEYLRLLKTHFNPRQPELRAAFNREIETDGFLTREPFVALSQPYAIAPPITELHRLARERFAPICETPYQHQADACKRILAGKATVVATGTGSGKTEAFLMPIIDHCLRVHKDGEDAVKAIFVYPMNALANDQCSRIRKLLVGTDISYGRYTRETKMCGSRPADAPKNERVLRREFREHPPDLLLTNYMMLEYMLMRGDGRDMFKNHRVRFIVLDEVHTYHGLLGTDVACLLRRLREALGKVAAAPEPLLIGTSATLQAGAEGDAKAGVAGFFTQLTGQDTLPEAVIMETVKASSVPMGLKLPAPPAITEDELAAFEAADAAKVRSLLFKLTGERPAGDGTVEAVWDRAALPHLLLQWLRNPISENEIVRLLAKRPERGGVPEDALRREVEAALLLGPCIPEASAVKLRPRVHRFLRGLAHFWRCTNPECGKLLAENIEQCDECESRALPLAICRTCGWDFLMARQGEDGTLSPWRFRRSDKNTVFLFDPPTERVEVEGEEDLSAEEEQEEGEGEASDRGAVSAEEQSAATGREAPDAYLHPTNLRLTDAPDESTGEGAALRPVRLYRGRGTRCPVCASTYGRFDIITPVSMGNSSALAHVSRVLMRDLPEAEQKLLVFCDSRQDAAHQARFIEGVEGHLRLRRVVYAVLRNEPEPHDFEWLVNAVYEAYIAEGVFSPTRKKDEQRRRKSQIEGQLLHEFAIAPRVRAGIERLGLVKVRYAGIEEELASEAFKRLCAEHSLLPDMAAHSLVVLLNEMRQRMALGHEALRTRMYPNDKLARLYEIKVNRQVGIPVAFLPPEQKSASTGAFKLLSTWNLKGNQTSVQRLWRQFHAEYATPDSLDACLRWLQDKEYLAWSRVGKAEESGEGYQVNLEMVEFEVGRSFLRCSVCDKVAVNEPSGRPCPRAGCSGTMQPWEGPLAEGNLNALMAVENYAPPLYAAEHSAAVSDDQREKVEQGFMERVPARPNLLACTPTLEMGVNIGDLEAVAMRNIPPSPAHYAQRSGRTGRASRMGIVVGFSRNTPHDGYFFDHPGEVIAGAIPPPRFNIQNREAIGRHVRSLILEHAEIDFPSSLERFLTERGKIVDAQVKELLGKVTSATPAAVQVAARLWADVPLVTAEWLAEIGQRFPNELRTALGQRGALLAEAVTQIEALGTKVEPSPAESRAHRGYQDLAVKLRKDAKYAYLPRVLAEAGLLPGYSFPADPGSVALGYDPDPVFGGRLQAQREFAPGQIVYARGGRWRVTGVALHRPGSRGVFAQSMFDFTLCGSCGLANDPDRDFCARCSAPIGDDSGAGLQTFTAWDAGAFQAWEAEVAAESEEERLHSVFDIRPHPQADAGGVRYQVGSWALDLRQQESLWFINHGLKAAGKVAEEKAESPGFRLCPTCGEYFGEREREGDKPGKSKAATKDSRSQIDGHTKRCTGTPRDFSIGHKLRADTLRLCIPEMGKLGEEGVAWAWSLVYAMIQGAMRLFEIDEDDIEGHVLTKTVTEKGRQPYEEVLDILWIDRIIGGSGTLQRLATHFPKVAAAALEHLDGHDCPNSCYRCLRSYRNQRWHGLLDWRLAVPFLRALSGETVSEPAPVAGVTPVSPTEGPEWADAKAEGCESPQELRLLKAIRGDGALPEPDKQHEVYEGNRLLTRADFAYLDCKPMLLIYVDGLKWHSDVRQRTHDNRITNKLQTLNYRVLRFLGTETHHTPANCVSQIKEAMGMMG
ncbi:MAG: DEAD/DEAH box helicase [Phycisphaerales bacterium]|nr:DEAD/DEAH box helicase [Phycisphaerales bacterium]